MTTNDIVASLVNRDRPVDVEMWRSFWDRLHEGALRRGEATALVSSLSTRAPEAATIEALLDSLNERRTPPAVTSDQVVNIVGTGGGPRTFNVSTASALVAAAMGVRVVKTGSRSYSSRYGSVDLLERLHIPLARSYTELNDLLERFGIAFAGSFVYPMELTLLVKSILPFEIRSLGRFFNSVGPFLAAAPVSAQVTGVSDHALLSVLRQLAAADAEKRIWLCTNRLCVDELVSIAGNLIYPNPAAGGMRPEETAPIRLSPSALGLGAGELADLALPAGDGSPVDHFLALLSGDGSLVATQTVCLNAAALAMAAGVAGDWTTTLRSAMDVVEDGLAAALVQRLQQEGARSMGKRSPGGTFVGVSPHA